MIVVVDQQLPPALALWLADRGHAAAHVESLGLSAADDAAIWAYVESVGGALITKDRDFAERHQVQRALQAHVVWLRIGNTTNSALMRWLAPRWPLVEQRLVAGDRVIEVR
jgi:predicted nuclease of predicted toxin-antitoxin system